MDPEQLDVLLLSLKSYWGYSDQKGFLDEIKASANNVGEAEKVVDYQMREPFNTYFKIHKISNGRVGAINLEQLDLLLNSLKTYWDYTNQKSFFAELKASPTTTIRAEDELAYEL